MTINDEKVDGYESYFDFKPKDVEKGFWRYCREFTIPLNMKSYYQIKIPPSQNEGNVDIIFFSQTIEKDRGSILQVALNTKGIPSPQLSSYNYQILRMLSDFMLEGFLVVRTCLPHSREENELPLSEGESLHLTPTSLQVS